MVFQGGELDSSPPDGTGVRDVAGFFDYRSTPEGWVENSVSWEAGQQEG